ncbi:translational GTPase TypA [Candidatus Falkowbacteria bacterium CG_4_10_14_0_2_um_filter_48_10]|uniref:50S ribosomal subunit assembly factor BipA n=1 Tax=Candidatus Falkowbacteria bacterium CG23_combo_of_CG06-09_8_20_14_all_49_15 TaxID=1974572 RepID=A0A2G9ZKW1_9BACT|nr:MAG: translational GTPase TypA [Candidatus Falkowbacteria bacterium CG23_combo_of_CG06-09_8_20_14_all_49_15]PJA07623.1 MAG: translational GTPase TypA [Candidatus Falkowbacteria bacterium CG_4_10_14_0_2_um_filter_48_10]
MEIRNIAIIAHVDHGKTTLTDGLLRQTGMAAAGVSMDSNDLEQERGITIYSKNASLFYQGTKINLVDTPGHADFGSEVERVLRSIDSVVLVVDAQEGPMPQTKFVLKKSLELGFKPIVVINKIDKAAARPDEVKEMVYELFLDLGASDEQLDFTVLYAVARDGWAKKNLNDPDKDFSPLLNTIIQEVAPAGGEPKDRLPLLVQPFNLAYDNFLGRLAVSRVYQGIARPGAAVFVRNQTGELKRGKITKIFTFAGLERQETDAAPAGDIVLIAGLPDIFIGDTISANPEQPALPAIKIDEPTITLNFLVNNSPLAGHDGRFVTNRQLKERLQKELEVNVGLKIDFSQSDRYLVAGRGEMHIAILLENMRREGYELQVSQPNVIFKEIDGCRYEPFEEVTIIVPEKMSGTVIEKLSRRRGRMQEFKPDGGQVKIIFSIPTRGLFGYRNEFMIDTRGEGIIYSRVTGFEPFAGEISRYETGSMASQASGKALGFSLYNLQERGALYIGANTEVYEGMVIGNVAKGNDLVVNPIKGKHLTNMRASGSDEAIRLTPPLELSLERGLEIMKDDEYLEITPKNIRLRKIFLTENDRIRSYRKNSK